MKSINKNLMRQLVKQFDFVNTINGGISMTSLNVSNYDNKTELTVVAPSVNPELFNIYVNNNQLMIFSLLTVEEGEVSSKMAMPMFSQTVTIPPYVDIEKIEAIREENTLRIILPYKNDSKDTIRKIDIKHSF